MTLPDICARPLVRDIISRALEEDVATGDATTLALVPEDAIIEAHILAKQQCVISGGEVARTVFHAVDDAITVETVLADGEQVSDGATVLTIKGPARGILTAERTALNFMQRMTGIATLTRAFVDAVALYGTTILDTRKTTPALRDFEKYAVLCGGGINHRIGLYDKIMIKDNHRRLWRKDEAARLDLAVQAARETYPDLEIEVEVETLEELDSALAGRPEWILLDNMPPEQMAECVKRCAGRAKLEASGGIVLENAVAVAASGVDAISLGCLTHSAPAADLSLEIL